MADETRPPLSSDKKRIEEKRAFDEKRTEKRTPSLIAKVPLRGARTPDWGPPGQEIKVIKDEDVIISVLWRLWTGLWGKLGVDLEWDWIA